jgi:ATP-dependent Clp protease adaptor protein ClpS
MYAALVEALVLLLGAFGATSALWTLQARARLRESEQRAKKIATWLDADMQVALALAKHAASSRHQPFAPVPVMYALVQAEPVVEAIRALGADPSAVEDVLDGELERVPPVGDTAPDPHEGNKLLGTALGLARAHDHEMTLADTLNQLAHTPLATLLDAPPLSATDLLFRLVHGDVPPAVLPGETHVHVVIRNDDYTTQDLVVAILRDVFELPGDRAHAVMREAHDRGRTIIGRFTSELAKTKIEAARRRAREHASPLWLGVEVC